MENNTPSLWTRDFTIITAGTVVSMFGNAMADFAMSLMVLDISKSTLLYAVYLAMYTIPQIIMIAMLIQAVLAVIIIGGNRESISAIYNREQ